MPMPRLLLLLFISLEFVAGENSTGMAMEQLKEYGYLSKDNDTEVEINEQIKDAILQFQGFNGINQTGLLDNTTLNAMKRPRCGMPDIIQHTRSSAWRRKTLFYKIDTYIPGMSQLMIDQIAKDAFNIWSKYTDLSFKPRRRRPHIRISFARGNHGHSAYFDGPGKIIGHAQYPEIGWVHLDSEEDWTEKNQTGVNLYQILTHEIGHALGLDHSNVTTSIMTPFYNGYEPKYRQELDPDDIARIQELYGVKSIAPANFENFTCTKLIFDTIFTTKNGTFIFYQDKYVQLDGNMTRVDSGLARNKWHGLPSNVDSAYETRAGKMWFFKGTQYWRYSGNRLDASFPKYIYQGFRRMPLTVTVDAVFALNDTLYLFKDHQFYQYSNTNYTMPPKNISSLWSIEPRFLHAAFVLDKSVYLFRFLKYWKYNLNFEFEETGDFFDMFDCDDVKFLL